MVAAQTVAQIETRWEPTPQQDLGLVDEGQGVKERRFTVRNAGTYSWQIVRGYTSCGCTKVELREEQTVRPGDSALVVVHFDPAGKAGPFREVVTVQLTDGESLRNETLTLTGEVRRSTESLRRQFPAGDGDIRISAEKVDFGEISRSMITERHVVICNTGSRRQRVRWTASSPLIQSGHTLSAELGPSETLDLTLQWNGKKEQRWGLTRERLTITYAEGKSVTIDLAAILLPDLSAQDRTSAPTLQTERRINIGTLEPGKKIIQRLALQNVGRGDLHILRAYSEQEDVEIRGHFPLTIKPGSTASLEVIIVPNTTLDIPITLISDDARKPRQTVRLYKK